jgi:hypothetical protein
MCSHVPNKGEQMVRCQGYYSNVNRGRRKNKNQDEWMPWILEANESSKGYRKDRARLIQKIYEVNFGFTHKAESRIVSVRKRKFLSTNQLNLKVALLKILHLFPHHFPEITHHPYPLPKS